MLGAEDPLDHGQQRRVLVTGRDRIPRLPRPVSDAGAGDQRVGVPGTEDPLTYGQQRGELVAGRGPVPRLPGLIGEVAVG